MNYLNVLAKALYDNVAESPDELSFRKGDIMTVLERNTQGLDGWWLCSLHGRQGIVPGNRLKILVGMYDKKQPSLVQGQQQALQSPLPGHQQGGYNMPSPSSQYTAMHPAYPALSDDVYLMPATSKGQQSLYPSPPGIVPPPKQHHHGSCQRQGPHQFQNQPQDIYQVPPSHSQGQDIYQVPPSSKSSPQDIYQVPPSVGPTQDIYQVPPSMTQPQDIYQVPPSMDKRSWEGLKPASKVVVPTRIGQVYVYDAHKPEQDEYDTPRHLLPPPGSQEIYDVPPTRGGVTNQYNQELYDTPPMAVKGPSAREHAQEIYDIPPSVEKNSQSQTHFQQTVYDIPPSVSKDVPDRSVREETYDIPPAFAKQKTYDPSRLHPQALLHAGLAQEEFHSDDVYDIPPPGGKVMDATIPQDIYDVPPSLKKPGGHTLYQDVYDVPREILGPSCGKTSTEDDTDYIYDIPPQVDRDVKVSEELANNFKRLSASSTGSTRSNLSTSSLDIIPVKESTTISPKTTGKELNLDLDVAMDMLAKLQHSVESSVSHLMSFINKSWRTPEQMEPNVQNIRTAVERVKNSVKDLLEFSRGAVNNAAQATDRTLYTKLSKQLQKMEEAYQILLKHNQALDSCNWAISVLIINKQNSSDDLDRIVMHSRGIPDDTKQLASFLHGNASLLFKRTKHQSVSGDSKRDSSQMGLESGSMVSNNNLQVYHTGSTDKSNIQSRPLPSPPKFTAADSPEDHYENNESGWMEDYDYVHLQGKEEFEKTQKELLEKGNIMRHGKGQLEQQQLKQFERLEEEVTRPIDNDLSNWKPPQPYAQVRSKLCSSDKQLLLFYSEQCEANITTLTNAIDAFFTSINTNQPPKIFVAHSKFVILSAHKLVFIGDTLSRQAKAQDIRNKVTHHSNLLCNMLKEIVITTKTAALQYPSVTAAKEMMDRVKELSNSMQQFKMALGQLAAM